MRRLIIALVLSLVATGCALAQFSPCSLGVAGFCSHGASGGGGGCTNVSLAFTTACNSMYIPVIH